MRQEAGFFLFSVSICIVLTSTCCLAAAPAYERQKAAQTGQPSSGLVSSTSSRYGVKGYLARVPNPIGHFHVYFSQLSNGSCGGRQKTSEQALAHHCEWATNGSPFSFNAPTCIGSLVSDEKVIDAVASSFEYFGLTKDGYFLIGDLSANEVKTLGFSQLIMGFHWLVRNGTVVVNGGGEIAPRTVIGTNAAGELLILQVDGIESEKQGLTLEQAAIWSRDVGGFHVLNLDGGGSSATVYRGKIINRPTCEDTPTPICERPVTTITCVI